MPYVWPCPMCDHFRDIHSQNVPDLNLVLQNGPRSNLNGPIESPYSTSYVMAIVMLALSSNVCEIFAAELCATLTLTFRMGQGQMYANQITTWDYTCVGNRTVWPICHRLCDNDVRTSNLYSIRIFELDNEDQGRLTISLKIGVRTYFVEWHVRKNWRF